MDPSDQKSSDLSINSPLDSVSLIKPDPDTTLYLEDDTHDDSDLPLDNLALPKNCQDDKVWLSDQHLNIKNNDEVVDVLKPDQVRWFYRHIPNKQWIEFNGYDSLRIEQRYINLTDKEWKYYHTTYKSKKTQTSSLDFSQPLESKITVKSHANINSCNGTASEEYLSPPSEMCDKVVVRGGLYEVDVIRRSCSSIFWPGEETTITRGSWFYENSWQPVELDLSEDLEHVHLSMFIGKKNSDYIQDAKAPKKVLHTEVLAENKVDWYSPMEVYLYSQATPSKIVRNLTSRLGDYFQKKSGYRLLRGYRELATDEDKPKDISHLVFVVHGIGQKMDIGGRILHNTSLLRQNVTSLHEKLFPNSTERAEFFPVEWRTNLKLDGGLVEAITPLHLTQLRNILNTSAMDIMYYTSPIYCAEIQRGLTTELNRLYTMFLERNPGVPRDVKVSIVAHSLGCVIVYDIITGWLPMSPNNMYENAAQEIVPGKSRLNFHVDKLFMLGSPLAVFLALRYPRGQHGYHLFPPSLCNRLYNVFHISDAVAYRLEPLVIREYSRIAPLRIWPCNCPTRIAYSDMPLELIDPQDVPTPKDGAATPKEESPASPAETPVRERGWSIWNLVRGGGKNQDGVTSPAQMDSPTRGLEHRLDYVIKVTGSLGVSARTYINMLSSHTAYWGSDDIAFFVLTCIFPELDTMVDTSATEPSADSASTSTPTSVSAAPELL